MTMDNLMKDFICSKKDKPSNVNELLDFIQLCYLKEKISVVEYRNLFRELHQLGAVKPDYIEDPVSETAL